MHLLRSFKKVLLRPPFGHVSTGLMLPASSHMTGVNKGTHSRSSLFILKRLYCDGRQPELQPKVKTLYIPNPFVLLKNKWLTYRIQNEIDPDFNLDEFVIGASYAVSQLTQLMATEQYTAIKDLVYGENEAPVDILRDYVESLTNSKLIPEMHFTQEQISVIYPRLVEVRKESDNHLVTVDVAAVGFKMCDEMRSLILQMQIRFGQSYCTNVNSGWLIYNILYIRLQELTKSALN